MALDFLELQSSVGKPIVPAVFGDAAEAVKAIREISTPE